MPSVSIGAIAIGVVVGAIGVELPNYLLLAFIAFSRAITLAVNANFLTTLIAFEAVLT